MSGGKLSYARKAARFLVSQLTASDRLALVIFDHEVSVLMSSQPVRDPQPLLGAINTIHSGGRTALFDGWLAGALQAAEHLDPAALNRVLLLSDGKANRGLTDTSEIAAKVAGLTQRGVSTSAFLITQLAPRRARPSRSLVQRYRSDRGAQCDPIPEGPLPA